MIVSFAGVAQAGQVLLLLPLLRVRAVAVGRDVASAASVAAVQLERPAGDEVDVDVRAAKLDHQLQEVPQDQHGVLLDEVAERRTSSRRRLGECHRPLNWFLNFIVVVDVWLLPSGRPC